MGEGFQQVEAVLRANPVFARCVMFALRREPLRDLEGSQPGLGNYRTHRCGYRRGNSEEVTKFVFKVHR